MRPSALACAAALVLAGPAVPTLGAQNAAPVLLSAEAGPVGTIVVAHGGSDDWNAPVLRIVREADTGGPVEVSFLMGPAAERTRFQDAVARLVEQGARRIVVVLLLASSHSGHYEQVRWLTGERDDLSPTMMHHLHTAGIERPRAAVPFTLAPALDASMEIARILSERALKLAEEPAAQALFIIGHGPSSAEDYADWMANLRPVADSVARATGFTDVKLGLVRDDAAAPVREEAVRRIREIIQLQGELTDRPVVVVPLLVSRGTVSTEKLPRDLEGLDVAYDAEGLLPHPHIARWIERRVREAGAGARPSPSPEHGSAEAPGARARRATPAGPVLGSMDGAMAPRPGQVTLRRGELTRDGDPAPV